VAMHDLKCPVCGYVEMEVIVHHSQIQDGLANSECRKCGSTVRETYYGLWEGEDVNVFNDGLGGMFGYQRADKKGRVREFGVADDTLSKIQLGMFTKPTDKGLKNFTDDQTAHYRERLIAEGDSGKLRKEIMSTYESNKAKGL